jgi:hypothetical protein
MERRLARCSIGTSREKIAYLFSLSVEHRIVTLRLAVIVQGWLPGGLDFRGLIYFGNLSCAAAGVLVIWRVPATYRAWLAALAALLEAKYVNKLERFNDPVAVWSQGTVAGTAAHGTMAPPRGRPRHSQMPAL